MRYSDTSGINEQVKKVFWTLFVAMAGLVLARVVDLVTAQQVVGIITGMGGGCCITRKKQPICTICDGETAV